MAFETQSVNIQTKKILGVGEFAVSTKIGLDLEKPLMKVLSVKAISDVSSSESIDTDFNMLGKTQVSVLYVTENGTLESVVGYADWQHTLKVAGESLIAKVSVVETTVEATSASEVSISILHNAFVEGISKEQIMPITELPDGYVSKGETVSLNQITATASSKFVVAETLDMPNAVSILNTDACLKVKNVQSGIDQVSVEGEIDVKIFYATAEGTNTLTKTLDFKQEIGCLGAMPASQSFAQASVSSINATLEVGEKTSLVIALNVFAVVDAYDTREISVITDLYSLNKNLETITDCVAFTNFVANKNYTDTVVCNVELENANVDEVVSLISPVVELSQSSVVDNSIVVEGVVNATLIYKDNQAETTNSYNLSCPFVSKVDTDTTGSLDSVSVACNLSSVKIRSGKEVEVVLDLAIGAQNNKDNYFEYVKTVNELGDKEFSNSAITIYVTKEGESLFNVARALNVMPETITSQNEVVDGKFAGGQRIFVYSPLNVEF